jgi:hypothetical protein
LKLFCLIALFGTIVGCGSAGGNNSAIFQKSQTIAFLLASDSNSPIQNLAIKTGSDDLAIYSGVIFPDTVVPPSSQFSPSKTLANFTSTLTGQGFGNVRAGAIPGGSAQFVSGDAQKKYAIQWQFDIKSDSVDVTVIEVTNDFGPLQGPTITTLRQVSEAAYRTFLKEKLHVVESYSYLQNLKPDATAFTNLKEMCESLFKVSCDGL